MNVKMGWILLGFVLFTPLLAQAQGCQESALHTEFYTDTSQRGYSACSTDGDLANPNTTDDICVQGKLNAPCTNHPSCKTDQTVTREHIWEVINATELETLYRSTQANDVARKGQLDAMSNVATFDMGKGEVRQKWFNIFTGPGSPNTNAAIAALQQKDVPRCDVVCKKGSSCSLSDVSLGLRGVQ